jgi:hypothetical protein
LREKKSTFHGTLKLSRKSIRKRNVATFGRDYYSCMRQTIEREKVSLVKKMSFIRGQTSEILKIKV